MRADIEFPSGDAALRGWLYATESSGRSPAVVMAHGFSATRHMTADKYALAYLAAGFKVLLFDHRGFGASGGEPRQQYNPWQQARGYRDAISYLLSRSDVAENGVAIWGDSASGGVATTVAAVDERVAALVLQVPAFGAEVPPEDREGSRFRAIAETLLSGDVEPREGDIQGPMPVVSDDQVRRPSVLLPLTAYRWFIEYGGRLGSQWINDVTLAAPRTPEPWNPALCALHVRCPALFLVAPHSCPRQLRGVGPTRDVGWACVAKHSPPIPRGPT